MRSSSVQGAIESLYPLSKLIKKAIENPKKNNTALQNHFGYHTKPLKPISLTKQTEVVYFDKTNSEQIRVKKDQLLSHAYSVFLISTLRYSEPLRLDKPLGELKKQKENIKEDLSSDQILQWAEIYRTIPKAIEFKIDNSQDKFTFLEFKSLIELEQACDKSFNFLLEVLREKDVEKSNSLKT